MKFSRAILAATLAVAVASCALVPKPVTDAFSVVTQAKVPAEAVVLAASTFDGVKITATNYLRLRRCDGANAPICRDPALTSRIDAAIQSGTSARNRLKAFLRANPGELGLKGDYDALTTATATLQDATAAYRAAINK